MRSLFPLLAVGLIMVVLFLASSFSKTYAIDEKNCLSCHGNPALTKTSPEGKQISLYVSQEAVNTSAHRYIDCTTCHTSEPHKVDTPLTKLSLAEKCGSCHQYQYKLHLESIHGQQLVQGNPDVATCVDCHSPEGNPHSVIRVLEHQAPAYKKNIADTCEQCHRPGKFSGDLVRVHTTYLMDEQNTKKVDTRILRVGGGELGTAHDIHWLIGANVWYLAMDEKRQEIGWVGIENSQGELIAEYIDPDKAAELIHTDPKRIESEKRLMDCLDCHTRVTHIFESPEELIDTAFIQGKIDDGLPFIKREGVKVLDPPNSSLAEAIAKVEAIKDFYRTSYPGLYVSEGRVIEKAIGELKEIARLTTFPDMKVSWKTYIDNAGHQTSPGCLRCHGKLVAITGDQKGKVLDASCDLCHYRVEAQ